MPKANMKKAQPSGIIIARYEKALHHLRIVAFAALVIAVLSIFVSVMAIMFTNVAPAVNTTKSQFGSTLAGIDQPINSTQLSIINNAPDSYFQTAGLMLLNCSIDCQTVFLNNSKIAPYLVNGKPSVVYLGSITCVFCGENRWAMALALSRFGNFSQLFNGYSALGDSDVPTLYWTQDNYNASGEDAIGSSYASQYITFVPIEDINPITGPFALNPISTIQANIAATGNKTYIGALAYIINLSSNATTAFKGTPYTIWGDYQFSGADAEDFGNSTPTTNLPITYMTHAQIFNQLAAPNNLFAWREYAAADVYIAATCKSLNNTAPICSLTTIRALETLLA